MKARMLRGFLLVVVAGLPEGAAPARAATATTAFTYQGQLKQDGVPVSDTLPMVFSLWDAESGGSTVAPDVLHNSVEVVNGLFTVTLDFGPAAFTGEARWLEVAVGGSTLTPRQPITPTPYALRAVNGPASNWIDIGDNVALPEGNVGVGTAEPTAMLHLQRPLAGTALRFQTVRFQEGPPANQLRSPVSSLASGAGQPWSSPDSSRISDDARAGASFSAAAGIPDNNQSQPLELTNFGFTLPPEATVVGIVAQVEGLGNCICSDCDRCTIEGTVELIGGKGPSAQAPLIFQSTEGTQTLGWTFETWGLDWTASEVNAGSFGVRLSSALSLSDIFFCFPGFPCSYAPCDCTGSGSVGIDAVSVTAFFYDVSVTSMPVEWTIGVPETSSGLHLSPTADLSDPAIFVDTGGHVGINTTTPGSFHLAVNGNAAKLNGGSWSTFSDSRLKRDILPMIGTLDRLLSLHGYTFEYVPEAIEKRLASPGRQMGLLAEEVERVFPDWVEKDTEGYRYVTERATTALLVEALRELRAEKDAEVGSLRAELAELRQELSTLQTRRESEPFSQPAGRR